MMTTIVLPRLLGTREKGEAIVEATRFLDESDHSVEIAARAVKTVTPSFVNGLVDSLSERGIREINLLGASERFIDLAESACEKRGVLLRVSVAA